MPNPRNSVSAGYYNGKIYVMAGLNMPDQQTQVLTNIVEVYDIESDSWVGGVSAPRATGYAGAATVGDKIYLIGGFYTSRETNIYNVSTGQWEQGLYTAGVQGYCDAISAGVCDITASDSSGFSESISVRVTEPQGGSDVVFEKVNDNDARITYSGAWTPYSNDPSFYNNDEHFSKQTDAYAEFTFEGTGINWIGATSDNLGICDVYIDGELAQAGLDQYSSSLEAQKVLFSKTDLADGQHTIKIVITGEKNSNSVDVYGTLDAFEVIRTE